MGKHWLCWFWEELVIVGEALINGLIYSLLSMNLYILKSQAQQQLCVRLFIQTTILPEISQNPLRELDLLPTSPQAAWPEQKKTREHVPQHCWEPQWGKGGASKAGGKSGRREKNESWDVMFPKHLLFICLWSTKWARTEAGRQAER